MQDIDAFQVTAAVALGALALLYGVFVPVGIRSARWAFGPRVGVLIPLVGALAAVHFASYGAMGLVPVNLWDHPPRWLQILWIAGEWSLIWAVACGPEVWRIMGGARPPGRVWRVAVYGPAILLTALAVAFPYAFPGSLVERFQLYMTLRYLTSVYWIGWCVIGLRRPLPSSSWRPGIAGARAGRWDLAFVGAAFVVVVLAAPLVLRDFDTRGDARWLLLACDATVTSLLLLPWMGRARGEHARVLVLTSGVLLIVVPTLVGALAASQALRATGLARLADVTLIAAVLGLTAFARAATQRLFAHFVVSRRLRRFERVELALRTLPVEQGVIACCRSLAEALVAEGLVQGAAILLDDGETVVAGALDIEPLRRLWPWSNGGAASPPEGTLLPRRGEELPPPVVEALAQAPITSLAEVASPRRHWGCLCFGGVRPFTMFAGDEDRRGAAMGAQLALVLDAAALLERTVAAERSLAHAEKLAAVGRTAARIAHEIRNPVTAARSLAQILARRPLSPRSAEQAELILGELERIERQVAALLRMARRDEFRFEPVALDELLRATLVGLGPRLEAAGVEVALGTVHAVLARGDRERLRQVLVNLVENALDAMAETGPRRLDVTLTRANGTASLAVADSGAGVSPALLPHLFEPFHSGKPHGTGLGLAIAKQTVEAHGGRIALSPAPVRGTVATVELPLGGEAVR